MIYQSINDSAKGLHKLVFEIMYPHKLDSIKIDDEILQLLYEKIHCSADCVQSKKHISFTNRIL